MPYVSDMVMEERERQFTREEHNHARRYAESFRKAIFDGNDELMYQLHQELNPEYMFYILVSTKLTAAEIRFIRSCIHDIEVRRSRS